MKLKRISLFLKRYLCKNPLYVIVYALTFWNRNFISRAVFLNKEELVESIIKGKSVLRFGDGEINLLLGLPNHYQTFQPLLQKKLFEILLTYDEDSPYILSIPRFVNVSNVELQKNNKRFVWMPLKVIFKLYFNFIPKYLDAHAFYYDGYFDSVVSPVLKNKHVLLITKQKTIEKQKNNHKIPWSKFSHISVPEEEIFSGKDSIVDKINVFLQGKLVTEVVILLALGPVGKWIGYEFSQRSVQCIDIGKVAEVMHTGESIEFLI
jgi:hypothetical protein